MLSDFYVGEWGFSALIEADGKKILFDTGSRPNTVIINAKELNIDLTNIDDVFLSHNHKDHTGGLMNLKKNRKKFVIRNIVDYGKLNFNNNFQLK